MKRRQIHGTDLSIVIGEMSVAELKTGERRQSG